MGQVNKTSAAVLAGAVSTVVCWSLNHYASADIPVEVSGAIQTIITALLVFIVPNMERVAP